jgi:hypothetical protein
MKFKLKVIWTQWYFGLWWWPVKKDRAFGLNFGPVHFIWTRDSDYS